MLKYLVFALPLKTESSLSKLCAGKTDPPVHSRHAIWLTHTAPFHHVSNRQRIAG